MLYLRTNDQRITSGPTVCAGRLWPAAVRPGNGSVGASNLLALLANWGRGRDLRVAAVTASRDEGSELPVRDLELHDREGRDAY